MNFNSIEFLIFLPIVVILYFALPQRYRWAMLLVASLYFYMSWSPDLLLLILFTIFVSFFASHGIARTESKAKKRLLLTLTLVSCLGVLFFFKYYNFLADSVVSVLQHFALPIEDMSLQLLLPVGISFYTFQTLSYVIDVYRGSIEPERHFGYYALFVVFFPQLVAGPIERPDNLMPQLHEHHTPKWSDFSAGCSKMFIGFFKKVVVADGIAVFVNAVYNDPTSTTGFGVVLASMLFAFQIYCDFAGYTDIAIGAARLLGIHLMQNFNRPYIAQSIKEFWSRWHISLSTWFRDYLYIPLGGNRCSRPRHLWNLFFVFFVSGLWHGAAWTFVIWGAMHGIYQVLGILLRKPRAVLCHMLHIPTDARWVAVVRCLFTYILVCFSWIFFRANSMKDLGVLLKTLFTDWSLAPSYWIGTLDDMGFTLITGLITVVSLILLQRLDSFGLSDGEDTLCGATPRSAYRCSCIIWIIAIAWLVVLAGDGTSAFIYFQF